MHHRLFNNNPQAWLRGSLAQLRQACREFSAHEEAEGRNQTIIESIKSCGKNLADSIEKKLNDPYPYNKLCSEDAQAYSNLVSAACNAIIDLNVEKVTALKELCNDKILDERERYWMSALFYGLLSLWLLLVIPLTICTFPLPVQSTVVLLVFMGIASTITFATSAWNAYKALSTVATKDLALELHDSIAAHL